MAIPMSRCWSASNEVRPNTTAVAESVEVYCALTPKIDTCDCGSNLRTYPASAPSDVPSFGLFENVGSNNQGEGASFGPSVGASLGASGVAGRRPLPLRVRHGCTEAASGEKRHREATPDFAPCLNLSLKHGG